MTPRCPLILRRRSTLSGALCALALTCGCSQMNSASLNAEGVRMYQKGDFGQSVDRFQKAIAANPRDATSYYNLASSLHRAGQQYNRPQDLENAERLYNQCLDYDGNHAECYRGLAVLLTETNRQDSAYRLLEGWASRSPQNPEARIELARLLEESQRYPQATTQLVEALAIDPNNPRALTALGRLREMSGDKAQALANYQRSLAANRYQPQVAARVAALQASGVGQAPMMAQPQPQTPTRTVDRWQNSARY